ncbi:MGMT family protein [Aliikangiella sp. IMCC44653]
MLNTPAASLAKAEKIYWVVNQVPLGKVVSYGQVADLAGLPGRARMVGKALRQAPKKLTLAWHRVIRSNGQLAFAAGSEQAQQQTKLLSQERVIVINNRVSMKKFQWQPSLGELLALNF